MSIKERTYAFIEHKGITVKHFEELCNLSNGYISSMRKGFGSDKLNNVLKSFPELNRDWLLYGEGDMITENSPQINNSGEFTNTGDINNTINMANHKEEDFFLITSKMLKQIDMILDQSNRILTIIEKKL